jgi:hypothetical protein
MQSNELAAELQADALAVDLGARREPLALRGGEARSRAFAPC